MELKYLERMTRDGVAANLEKSSSVKARLGTMTCQEKCDYKIWLAELMREAQKVTTS